MKSILFPLLLLGVLMLSGCEKENLEPAESDMATRSEVETRSLDDPDGIAFFAHGKTSSAELPEDPGDCLSQGFPFVDQQGKGVIPTYGPMAMRFTFCIDPSTVNEGFINYFNAKATFTLANGDELYAEGEGTVIIDNPNANPKAFFKDEFHFTGAKIGGEMKTAEGSFMTDSKVFNIFTPQEFTRHKFTGNLKILED